MNSTNISTVSGASWRKNKLSALSNVSISRISSSESAKSNTIEVFRHTFFVRGLGYDHNAVLNEEPKRRLGYAFPILRAGFTKDLIREKFVPPFRKGRP
jgi:hypothetical protein